MPTNKERSDVALRLRYVAEHGAPEWETIACCIAECLGENDYPLWENSDKLFDLLANLIEPESERTCRWEHIEGTWFVSECGKRYNCVIPDNFCPNCGAKVVN